MLWSLIKLYAKYISNFLLCQFTEAELVTLAAIFVFFVDKLSIAITISSDSVTEVSQTLFKYLLFSQIHVLGFQL